MGEMHLCGIATIVGADHPAAAVSSGRSSCATAVAGKSTSDPTTEQATHDLLRGRGRAPRRDRRPLSQLRFRRSSSDWFAARGWQPAPAPAGDARRARGRAQRPAGRRDRRGQDAGRLPADHLSSWSRSPAEGLHTLYVSPLKALAVDVQRNLLAPIEEMGLPIRVETRTGDTPSDRKARQRVRPPQILLTTPEIAEPAAQLSRQRAAVRRLKTVVVDEIHAFATDKRGDLLALSLARLQALAPGLRRVGLSARPSAIPTPIAAGSRPTPTSTLVDLVEGDPGAEPDLSILIPEDQHPLVGPFGPPRRARGDGADRAAQDHAGLLQHAQPRRADLPGAVGRSTTRRCRSASTTAAWRRSAAQGRGGDGARASCARWSPPPASTSASTGATSTWSSRWARPRARRACSSGSAAPTTGSTSRRKGMIVPGNRFEYLEAPRRARRDRRRRARPRESSAPARSTCSPSTSSPSPAPAPFDEAELLAEVRSAAPYAGLTRRDASPRSSNFIATGGYALKAYDKFRRLVAAKPTAAGASPSPRSPPQHRMNAGIIVEQPMMDVRFKNGRKLGTVEEGFASTLDARRPLLLRRPRASRSSGSRTPTSSSTPRRSRRGSSPTAASACRCRPTSPTASAHMLADRNDWPRFPDDVREWLEVQDRALAPARAATNCWSRPSRTRGRHYMVAYSFEGWNAHQSLGMLITKRMENAGLKPLGFVANDYAPRLLRAGAGHRPASRCSRPTSSSTNSSTGSSNRYLLKTRLPRGRGDRRAGRAPASRASARPAGRSASRPTSSTTCCATTSPSICCCAPPGTTRAPG